MSTLAQKLDEVRNAAAIAKKLTPAMVRAMTAPSMTDSDGIWPREWVVANESSPGSLTVYAKVNTTVALMARELLAAGRYNEAGNVGHDFTDLGLIVRDVLVRGAEVLLEETRQEYEIANATEQQVCVTCEQPIALAAGAQTRYVHAIDADFYRSIGDHEAEPRPAQQASTEVSGIRYVVETRPSINRDQAWRPEGGYHTKEAAARNAERIAKNRLACDVRVIVPGRERGDVLRVVGYRAGEQPESQNHAANGFNELVAELLPSADDKAELDAAWDALEASPAPAPLRNDGGDFPALSSRLGGLLSMPVKPREPEVVASIEPPPDQRNHNGGSDE